MRIALLGEALIDFVSTGPMGFQGYPGGSPLNTAVACARLGQPTGFLTQLSTDLFGERLLGHLRENGVDTRFVLRSDAPSTLAFVEHLPGSNRYAFFRNGAAEAGYAPRPLPELPPETAFLHFGSISLLQEPAASSIEAVVSRNAGRRVLVLDPNVRPSLIPDLAAYRARFARWLSATDLMKLSDEDVELLAPGVSPAQAAAEWLAAGPRAVVITYGASGAILHRPGAAPLEVSAPSVAVVDTVGAGDTFTAGLSVALAQREVTSAQELAHLPDETWHEVLRFAAAAAALNCTRAGANPPRLAEVLAFLGWAR
ncbi:MAG TPA: carbohydrate kinase [Anaeromyxobacter sp.]|nr:carbohydrate kinase [Anaeromyxobacter sp.]